MAIMRFEQVQKIHFSEKNILEFGPLLTGVNVATMSQQNSSLCRTLEDRLNGSVGVGILLLLLFVLDM